MSARTWHRNGTGGNENHLLTKEHIVFWVSSFKHDDIDDIRYQGDIIDLFVGSVYLCDDGRYLLSVSYQEDAKSVTLEDVVRSDTTSPGSPLKQTKRFSNRRDFGFLLSLIGHPFTCKISYDLRGIDHRRANTCTVKEAQSIQQ